MDVYVHGCIEKDGKILLLLRSKNASYFSNYYGLVGGKVDPDESVKNALIRELQEEINIFADQHKMQLAHCLSFKNEKGMDLLNIMFKISSWSGEIVNKEKEKHPELAWFAVDELPHNVIPRHRQAIELAYKGVLYSEDGW